ncbi:MAG: hypothetical protein V3V08_09415 [Nannocystaceae bacterium]
MKRLQFSPPAGRIEQVIAVALLENPLDLDLDLESFLVRRLRDSSPPLASDYLPNVGPVEVEPLVVASDIESEGLPADRSSGVVVRRPPRRGSASGDQPQDGPEARQHPVARASEKKRLGASLDADVRAWSRLLDGDPGQSLNLDVASLAAERDEPGPGLATEPEDDLPAPWVGRISGSHGVAEVLVGDHTAPFLQLERTRPIRVRGGLCRQSVRRRRCGGLSRADR